MYHIALLAIIILHSWAVAAEAALGVTLYVAPDGNDGWSGALPEVDAAGGDGPLATLEGARDQIRKLKAAQGLPVGGVVVELMPGTYRLDESFTLTAEDGGTGDAPVVYRAREKGAAIITGAAAVDQVVAVTDAAISERLAPEARERVVQADLGALGIDDFGSPAGGGIEVFFRDEPMTLARWPNEGFARIKDIVVDDGHQIHGQRGSKTGKFLYDGDRPERWAAEPSAWLHGYWFWDWSDERQAVAEINTEQAWMRLAEPYHNYGYRKGQWYYAYNLLAELDAPGEWYVDRDAGILYFWPPAPVAPGDITVSVAPHLVTIKDAQHITLHGLVFEGARDLAIAVRRGAFNRVAACVIRNSGGNAISITDGAGHSVYGCDIYNMGGGGVMVSGGDRETLEGGGHVVGNNHIHRYGRWHRMYHPGIALRGVGLQARHNHIHDAPHIGIQFSGNDHLIEFNEIHHVCLESNDAGAIYTGRNWTMRGNIIRHNYLYEILGFKERDCVGVYLDDMFSSAAIEGNVFYRVTRAAFIGGGRDCSVTNNIFVNCTPALHVDARALGWAHYHADQWLEEADTEGTLQGIKYDQPPYSERYPELVGMLEDEPKAPKGNVIARNIFHGGQWDGIHEAARHYLSIEDNLIDEDPRFVDLDKRDFRLREDSPAFALGFEPIPIERIGLYEHPDRASPLRKDNTAN